MKNYIGDFVRDVDATRKNHGYGEEDEVVIEIIQPLVSQVRLMWENGKSEEKKTALNLFGVEDPDYSALSPTGALLCQGKNGRGCKEEHLIYPLFFKRLQKNEQI